MIKNLQILRAIAATLVMFFHFNKYPYKIGLFGVDIFFIISGFIIAVVVNKSTNNFLMKRIIRVVPMYYFFTTLLIILISCNLILSKIDISPESIFKSLTFIPYTKNNSGPILSLGWTLNYEMYFYLLIFISTKISKKPKFILTLTSFIIIINILLSFILSSTTFYNQYFNFYGNPIALEFIFGIIIYYVSNISDNINYFNKIIFLLISIISFLFLIKYDLEKFNFNKTIFIGIPSSLIVYTFIIFESTINNSTKYLNFLFKIGNASYIVYLIHPFIISLFLKISFYYNFNNFINLIFILILTYIISIFLHNIFEKKIIYFLNKYV